MNDNILKFHNTIKLLENKMKELFISSQYMFL